MSDIDVAAAQVEIGARHIFDGGQVLAQGTTGQAEMLKAMVGAFKLKEQLKNRDGTFRCGSRFF